MLRRLCYTLGRCRVEAQCTSTTAATAGSHSNGRRQRQRQRAHYTAAACLFAVPLAASQCGHNDDEHVDVAPSVFFRRPACKTVPTPTASDSHVARFNFVADAVERAAPAVVHITFTENIRTPLGPVESRNGGSGVIVRGDGLVVTNAHVVRAGPYVRAGGRHGRGQPQPRVNVLMADGREFVGRVVAVDRASDLAAIQLDNASGLPSLPLRCSPRAGEFVLAIGSPFLVLSNSVTFGILSNTRRRLNELGLNTRIDYFQTDAAINEGNSGGPLLDVDGNVIGITTMKLAQGEGVSFAIPAQYVEEFIGHVEKQEKKSAKGAASSWLPWASQRVSGDTQPAVAEQSRPASPTPPAGDPERGGGARYFGISYYLLDEEAVLRWRQRAPHGAQPPKCGAVVHSVTVGSPAHLVGIRPGDVITHINGEAIAPSTDILHILQKSKVVQLQVDRHGSEVRMEIDFD